MAPTDREVSHEEAKTVEKNNNCKYFEVSAKTGQNVDEVFVYISEQLFKKFGEDGSVARSLEISRNRSEAGITLGSRRTSRKLSSIDIVLEESHITVKKGRSHKCKC